MPSMTNEQRIQFLKHVHQCIFGFARFPFKEPPGTPKFQQLVNMFQDRVKTIRTGPEWAPWVFGIGGQAIAKTFKCAERGAHILIGFDIKLDLGIGAPYPIRVLEQNPFKLKNGVLSKTAVLAQRGHKIAWVIKDDRSNTFLGKVQDGEWIATTPRAYTQKTMTPLRDMGAGIMSTDHAPDQYGVEHFNMDGEWVDDLDVIGGEDDVLGYV